MPSTGAERLHRPHSPDGFSHRLSRYALALTCAGLTTVMGACAASVEPAGPAGAAGSGGSTGGNGGGSTNGSGTVPDVGSAFQCDRKAPVDPGPSPLQRLTPGQYAATAHALFGEDLDLSDVLPEAASTGHIGLAQPDPSPVDVERYATAARRIGAHVATNITSFAPCKTSSELVASKACVGEMLDKLGTRIYRGPIADSDVTRLLKVYEVGFAGGGYAHGIGLLVEAMLQAPRFLYRPEFGDSARASETAVTLTGYETASRLSFAFWNRGPDQELLDAAAAGELDTPEGVAKAAGILAADPRGKQSFRNFLRVWFGLDDFDTVEKDPEMFSMWSTETRKGLDAQTEQFFDAVLFGSEGTLETLFSLDTAPFAPEDSEEWSSNDGASATGLFTLPALLSKHSKPYETFPIYRGLFVREQVLCQPLPPPPSNVGEPPEREEGVSSRERFEQHSSDPACRGCHQQIDPLGFAFENYDAIGRYRTEDEGHVIDASGTLTGTDVDGRFANLAELSALLASSDTVRLCAVRQWFRFAMQRFEQPADGCSMDPLAEAFAASDYRLATLRTAIVETPAFRMRRPISLEGE